MGRLFRRYWFPAMLSERLPEPDGAPIAVKLLGERLVAFRDTNGRIGLLDEFCPHRRVSLAYGRNEECGLRCVFYGWKLDVDGSVLETPAEPNPNFGAKIKHKAYPTREAGGIIWTYMRPNSEPPPFPDFPQLRVDARFTAIDNPVGAVAAILRRVFFRILDETGSVRIGRKAVFRALIFRRQLLRPAHRPAFREIGDRVVSIDGVSVGIHIDVHRPDARQ